MIVLILISLISVVWLSSAISPEYANPLSDEFIDYINSVQTLWTAGRNFHPNTSMKYLKKLQGFIKSQNNKLPKKTYEDRTIELPEEFDARKQWPNCKSLNEIRDYGACFSYWAMSTTEVMTDRYCIHSGQKQDFHFSTIDLQTCTYSNSGCYGGYPADAWYTYKDRGVVSGGNYNSSSGCRPYPYRNCNHDQAADDGYPDCSQVKESHELCTEKCVTNDIKYENDLKKAKTVYGVEGELDIMEEIYKNGPVVATFIVYQDFFAYKKGVYKHTAGLSTGLYACRILGWGVENNVKYWLVANSWNEYWGDGGYFKILRGENHCYIESDGTAGIPLYS